MGKGTPEGQGAVITSEIVEGIARGLESIPEKLKTKTGNVDKKKLLLMNLPYVLAGYFYDKAARLWWVSPGQDASIKMMAVVAGIEGSFSNPSSSLYPKDLLMGMGCGVTFHLVVYFKTESVRKSRHGMRYGPARWGNARDIKPYVDLVFENNVLLTETGRPMTSDGPGQPRYARNRNILVVDSSGSNKARFFIKPNLMQMHSSYVVTDPKDTVLVEYGKMLLKNSYRVEALNAINFKKSMHYNPFIYIRSEKDILKLVNTIILDTKRGGQQSGENFWVKAEKLYCTALIGYIWYECAEEEQNFTTLPDMINASEAREGSEGFRNPVDLMFDELEERKSRHFAVKQYKKYRLTTGRTARSTLIGYGAHLAPSNIKELRDLISCDELRFDMLGDEKTAPFVTISDTDDTLSFTVSIVYTQLFNLLCDRADDVYHGRLPAHVRCLLDEFINIGQILKSERLIVTVRSREISTSIILQSKSQLRAAYKDNADTIERSCDTTSFFGGKEKTALKEMAEISSRETIDLYNTSDTEGTS